MDVFLNYSCLAKASVDDTSNKATLLIAHDSHALIDLNCFLSMPMDHRPERGQIPDEWCAHERGEAVGSCGHVEACRGEVL